MDEATDASFSASERRESTLDGKSHKNSRNEFCQCKINLHHSTIPSPHYDQDNRVCKGPLQDLIDIESGIIRSCTWCGRSEKYIQNEIIIIFKKGILPAEAENFVKHVLHNNTKLEKKALLVGSGLVAIRATFETKHSSAAEWIDIVERRGDLILAAIPPMNIVFETTSDNQKKVRIKSATSKRRGPEEPPSEFINH